MNTPESHPVRARFYADHAVQRSATITCFEKLAPDIFRIGIDCPEIAARFVPGQFIMVRLPGRDDPLLGRPMAIYDSSNDPSGHPRQIDFVFLRIGKATQWLARAAPGQSLSVWGPLGNGFPVRAAEHLIMVAGGIGQTPFLPLAKQYLHRTRYGLPAQEVDRARTMTLCFGARTAQLLAGVDDFEALGVDVRLATDDGTRGHHGLVTDVLAKLLEDVTRTSRIVCCGPEPMMAATSRLAAEAGVTCDVSLETPMACGIGICFSCVARVRQPNGDWDYKRTCVDGPVFEATQIVW